MSSIVDNEFNNKCLRNLFSSLKKPPCRYIIITYILYIIIFSYLGRFISKSRQTDDDLFVNRGRYTKTEIVKLK